MTLQEPLSQRLGSAALDQALAADCVSYPLTWLDPANGYCKPPLNTPRLVCSSIALPAFPGGQTSTGQRDDSNRQRPVADLQRGLCD